MTSETLDEGKWCENCEYFEVDAEMDPDCMSCGCSANSHIDAKVVKVE